MKNSAFVKVISIFMMFFTLLLNNTSVDAVHKYGNGNIEFLKNILSVRGYIVPYHIHANYGHSLSLSLSYIIYGDSHYEGQVYQFIAAEYYSRPPEQLSKEREALKNNLGSEDKRNPVLEMQLILAWLKSIDNNRAVILFSVDRNMTISSEVFLSLQESVQTAAAEHMTLALNNNPIILVFDYATQTYLPAFNVNSALPNDFQFLRSDRKVSFMSAGVTYAAAIIFFLMVYYIINS